LHGFTLPELLIVMAVVGVMGVIFVINYPASQQRARDAVRRNDIKQYQAALEIFASRNNQLYPAVDGNLVNMCAALLGRVVFVRTTPDGRVWEGINMLRRDQEPVM
jgi:prepilin-type N-terminal cleavage/methylation domain-containing protein